MEQHKEINAYSVIKESYKEYMNHPDTVSEIIIIYEGKKTKLRISSSPVGKYLKEKKSGTLKNYFFDYTLPQFMQNIHKYN